MKKLLAFFAFFLCAMGIVFFNASTLWAAPSCDDVSFGGGTCSGLGKVNASGCTGCTGANVRCCDTAPSGGGSSSCYDTSFSGGTCPSGTSNSSSCSPACSGTMRCCAPSGGGATGATGGGTCPTPCQSTCAAGTTPSGKTCSGGTGSSCCEASSGGGGGGGGTPGGGGGGTTGGTVSFANPLSFTTVEGLLGAILNALQGIIVLLALVFIVFGALVYVTSGGNDKRIELAKEAIFAAMIGLALGIAAPSFLREIAHILGWTSMPTEVSTARTITQILSNVLNFFLGILGVLAVIMLVVGGFMYVTSAGNEDMIDRGKKIVVWSCVGVVVTFSSLILINQIASFF